MRRLPAWLLVALLWPLTAFAHKPSDAYLRMSIDRGGLAGSWDIAIRDLDHALGLDLNGDGRIIWGELRAREAEVAAYALARLDIATAAGACAIAAGQMLVDRHGDGAYAVLPLDVRCPGAVSAVRLDYRLFAELDRLHRGLVQVADGDVAHSAVLSPAMPTMRVTRSAPDRLAEALAFVGHGVSHVAGGTDHVLFLVCLLLPAVLRRRDGRWEPAVGLGPALADVARIVAAFTLAHSLTLALAATGVLVLPGRLVEPAIAATIVLAALNNLKPIVTRRLWLLAFAFGLVHGLGFAGALQSLDLPRASLVSALLAFNLGVELVQLGIVALLLPAAFLLRQGPAYQPVILNGGSTAIALAGCLWLVDRLG